MTPLPPTAVQIEDGQITIDADVLAPKLGLAVDALKENMAKGLVVSVTETGEGADAGRTRLTFRYRARVWRIVVDVDGRLFEDPVPVAEAKAADGSFSLFDFVKEAS